MYYIYYTQIPENLNDYLMLIYSFSETDPNITIATSHFKFNFNVRNREVSTSDLLKASWKGNKITDGK